MTYTEAWNKIVGYKAERNGMDYERAYRWTKAEFQKSEEYSHPYYWAAFALYE